MDKNKELLKAAMPLIEYLRSNHHPHIKAIVDVNSVELMEGVLMGKPIGDKKVGHWRDDHLSENES